MDKFKITTAILGAGYIYDLYIGHKMKTRACEIVDENTTLRELLAESHLRAEYLASMIDKHEIELDEFDKIAIINPL